MSLLAVSALAACGGSGSGGSDPVSEFDALVASATNTLNTYENFETNEGFTPFGAIGAEPDGGTAIYDGYAGVSQTRIVDDAPVEYAAIGSFTATADFSAPNVTARADGFLDVATGDPLTGAFDLTLPIFETNGDAGVGGGGNIVSGTLTWADSSELSSTTFAGIGGAFVGQDIDALELNGSFSSGDGGGGTIRMIGLRQ